MNDVEWQNRLLEQKSLFHVFWVANRTIPKSRGNRIAVYACSAIVLISTLFGWYHGVYDVNQSYGLIHTIADIGLMLSVSILGFLVAGFSIFAGITKPEVFILLAKIDYKKPEISNFQYVFFIFLNVFTVYVLLLVACMIISIGFDKNSPTTHLSQLAYSINPNVCMTVNVAALFFMVGLLAESIVRVKSFIWNLYQAVIMVITTEDLMNKLGDQSKDKT
ncbi:MAG: hypothetical protein AAGB02_05625 [Pseudomonadota bacterium]